MRAVDIHPTTRDSTASMSLTKQAAPSFESPRLAGAAALGPGVVGQRRRRSSRVSGRLVALVGMIAGQCVADPGLGRIGGRARQLKPELLRCPPRGPPARTAAR